MITQELPGTSAAGSARPTSPVSTPGSVRTTAEPEDVAPHALERALADPSWTAEVWPGGDRAWLRISGGEALLAPDAGFGPERMQRARLLVAAAAARGNYRALGEAVLDVVVVAVGDVRFDPVDIVALDGAALAPLPYAIRALALADAMERLRERSPGGDVPLLRPARTPAMGAAKRTLVGGSDPIRLVLRDLRAAYGMPGAILRVPSPTAGLFDDPWRDALDPA